MISLSRLEYPLFADEKQLEQLKVVSALRICLMDERELYFFQPPTAKVMKLFPIFISYSGK